MTLRKISRRSFCHASAGAGLLAVPDLLRGRAPSDLTAREVVARIRKQVGVKWQTPTDDEFKFGDPDGDTTGITTTFMCTLDLLKRSLAAGNNFVITHEPTFWSDSEVPDLNNDPLYRKKLDFVARNKMIVWRFHSHWHTRKPDGILTGFNKAMGWESYAVPGKNFWPEYIVPETSFENLARDMRAKLKIRSVRLVGDPKLKVTRVGHGIHGIETCMRVLPIVDVVVVFECREWEAAEYVRDAIAAGYNKALIQLPHEGGEEAGMDECARWLRMFVSEVPIKFIPSGDPFWMPV